MFTKKDRQSIYALAGALDAIAVEMKKANEISRDRYVIDARNAESAERVATVNENVAEMLRPALESTAKMLDMSSSLMDEYSDMD